MKRMFGGLRGSACLAIAAAGSGDDSDTAGDIASGKAVEDAIDDVTGSTDAAGRAAEDAA
jgi:hypothetical protein